MNRKENVPGSSSQLARAAAILFFVVVLQGMSMELFVRPAILVPGDAAATISNLAASESLFRLSIVSDLIRQVFLALLALATYRLFKPVNITVAGLLLIFAMLSIPINMLNELNHFAALRLAVAADYLPAFGAERLQALVTFFLELHQYGTYIAGAFSLWIGFLGYLAFKSRYVPRFLGIWLMLGGVGYVAQSILFYLAPDFDAIIFGLFAFAGEALFYLWLLFKGVRATTGP